ncbi:uncharacterized protein LOC142767564 [Rhipicephalus microplus]|uniref:uncharacterized protein LOC142767564 n=1 Tax=Rhipicephalus microplus TaxID=6941 RepID=UPI003F6CB0EF
MTLYNPSQPMPAQVLHDLVTVRECWGAHWNFPFGNSTLGEFNAELMPPVYNGYTFRVFFYTSKDTDEAGIQIHYSDRWYVKVAVTKGEARTYYSDDKHKHQTVSFNEVVKPGGYYSVGIRVTNNDKLQAIFNDKIGDEHSMGDSINKWRTSYKMNIYRGDHIILSIHISDEARLGQFPPTGFEKGLNLWQFPARNGSTTAVLYMCVDPSRTMLVGVRGTLFYGVEVAKIEAGQHFRVLFRNLPSHFTVASDFNNVPQRLPIDPDLKVDRLRDYLSPLGSDGCCIKVVIQDCL